ncbi:MAG TPA: STAS domain-containing protein [Gemmataceae bacterium]|nr:STAS domain-containing protein [Gemmataceae bacterium]
MSATPTPSSVEVRHEGTRTAARFTGCDSLNEFNTDAIEQLSRLIEGRTRPQLDLDLVGIRYLSSSALGKLLALNRKVRAAGGQLVLCNPSPAVVEILTITGLHTILEVRRADARHPEGLSA